MPGYPGGHVGIALCECRQPPGAGRLLLIKSLIQLLAEGFPTLVEYPVMPINRNSWAEHAKRGCGHGRVESIDFHQGPSHMNAAALLPAPRAAPRGANTMMVEPCSNQPTAG